MAEGKKSGWEIFEMFIPIITSLVVVIAGGYVTQEYQKTQQDKDNQLKQENLLVELMPYLSSKDSIESSAAIYTLRCLGYDSLAGEIGSKINTIGTRSAIKDISTDSTVSLARRKIYIDKWSRLRKMPARTFKPDTADRRKIPSATNLLLH